jgi:hypothetical protein
LCRFHHPDTEAERAEARRKGGAGKSHAARAQRQMVTYTIGGVRAILSTVLRDLLEGRIETGVATAAATLGRAVITANEKGEMEARIAELERRAGVVPEAGQD